MRILPKDLDFYRDSRQQFGSTATVTKRRRLALGAIFLAAVTVCTSGCDEGALAPVRVRVGYLPMVSSLTYFVAVENKYFIDEDIQIEALPIKTSNQIAQDLATGNIDAAIELSVVPLLQTMTTKEVPFRIFSTSAITQDEAFDGVIVRADSSAQSLSDLAGKKVGVFPGTTASATFGAVFKRLFPELPLPEFKPLDPALHLQSLANGDVDALHAYEPSLSIGLVEHGFRRLHGSIYAEQLSPSPIGVAAVNAKWYAANKLAAEALFRALDRAIDYIQTSRQDAKRILSVYTGAPPSVTARMSIMPMSRSQAIDAANLDTYLKILEGMKEIPAAVPVADILVHP